MNATRTSRGPIDDPQLKPGQLSAGFEKVKMGSQVLLATRNGNSLDFAYRIVPKNAAGAKTMKLDTKEDVCCKELTEGEKLAAQRMLVSAFHDMAWA